LRTKEFLKEFKDKIITIPYLRRKIDFFNDLLALIKLYFLFQREKFDIIHTHTAKAGVLARLAGFMARTKIIIHTPHGHNFYGYFGFFLTKIIILLERILAKLTTALVVFTNLEKEDFLSYRVIKENKIFMTPPMVEIEEEPQITEAIKLREEFNLDKDDLVVAMIGRLEPIKGVDYFIATAKLILKEPQNVRFLLIGEGSLRERLEKEVIISGFKDKIIFTGWRDDVYKFFSLINILVLPSLNEAVGLVLLEAQARGIPVVATRVGGIPEFVRDGENGILVPPRNVEKLTQAIKRLLKDKELREIMGKEGRNFVKDRFSPQITLERIRKLYKELLGNVY
ncbi:MAG: glycosyltransferase family 4 protein, partial [Candidatus Omnitrophica bacterium]|nr:glycosyltransferase family 4 protein [Candidatus Omnitrophota bacterium]